ncbi:MAG: DUF3866 family protein [Acidimicrobiales bacterium]
MPSFRKAKVVAITAERHGLQRLQVAMGEGETGESETAKAYALTSLTGAVAIGDEIVLNTTAVELGLGTGGWHVVHWNLSNEEFVSPGPGHIMKLRYSSLQTDTGSVEELHGESLAEVDDVDDMAVVVCGLHSQVACVAVAIRHLLPEAQIAYVMTDGAALPLALSDLVDDLVRRELINVTITAGQAFGGDHEAVNVASALVAARHVAGADITIVAMGPGVVGTATRLGYSALEAGPILDTVAWLGGRPIAALRFSQADQRLRHQGVSHHSLTALSLATHERVTVPVPIGPWEAPVRADLERAGITERHRVCSIDTPDISALLAESDLIVTSMGRGPDVDPGFFAVAGAAGAFAASL